MTRCPFRHIMGRLIHVGYISKDKQMLRVFLIVIAFIILMYSGCSSLRSRPDAASESQKLADLVITDISQSEYYIIVHYINLGGTASQGDFLVKVSADGKSFNGNFYYRFRIPEPRKPTKTGGFTKGLIGLKPFVQFLKDKGQEPKVLVMKALAKYKSEFSFLVFDSFFSLPAPIQEVLCSDDQSHPE